MSTIRLVLALAAKYNWTIQQLDIECAYLSAPLKETVYMKGVPGALLGEGKILQALQSIYGLKQSGCNFKNYLSQFLIEIGLKPSNNDACFFIHKDKDGKLVLICVYVDDIILTGDNMAFRKRVVDSLEIKFKVRNLGECHQLLGMIIDRYDEKIVVHQQPYIQRAIAEKYDLSDIKDFQTPAYENTYALHIKAAFDGDKRTDTTFDYRKAIGEIMHLANTTRCDIANAVRFLSQFVTNYTDIHIKFVKRVLKYLVATSHIGLVYKIDKKKNEKLEFKGIESSLRMQDEICELTNGFSDSSWNDNYEDTTSNSGMMIEFFGGIILWKSVKQRLLARSTLEAEWIACSHCVDLIINFREMLMEILDLNPDKTPAAVVETKTIDVYENILKATQLYGDNLAMITIGNASYETKRSRHINIRFHNVKNAVHDKIITLEYIPSKLNKADFFTKCLGREKFLFFRKRLMSG